MLSDIMFPNLPFHFLIVLAVLGTISKLMTTPFYSQTSMQSCAVLTTMLHLFVTQLRTAPSRGDKLCTYQKFCPFNKANPYFLFLVSGKRMQRFLRFRMSSHSLPIETDRRNWASIPRAARICSHCSILTVGDKQHLVFECPSLQPLRQPFFSINFPTTTVQSFFAQKDRMGVFKFIVDCLGQFDIECQVMLTKVHTTPAHLFSLHDTFQCGVRNFCSSIFQSLATVGHCMPRDSGVASAHDVPIWLHFYSNICEVPMIWTFIVQGWLRLSGSWVAPIITGECPTASGGAVVTCLFLVGACNACCSSGLPHIVYPLSLAVFLADSTLTGQTGCVHIVGVMQLRTSYTWYMNVQLNTHLDNSMQVCLPQTLTLWGLSFNKITCRFSTLFWIVFIFWIYDQVC